MTCAAQERQERSRARGKRRARTLKLCPSGVFPVTERVNDERVTVSNVLTSDDYRLGSLRCGGRGGCCEHASALQQRLLKSGACGCYPRLLPVHLPVARLQPRQQAAVATCAV